MKGREDRYKSQERDAILKAFWQGAADRSAGIHKPPKKHRQAYKNGWNRWR